MTWLIVAQVVMLVLVFGFGVVEGALCDQEDGHLLAIILPRPLARLWMRAWFRRHPLGVALSGRVSDDELRVTASMTDLRGRKFQVWP